MQGSGSGVHGARCRGSGLGTPGIPRWTRTALVWGLGFRVRVRLQGVGFGVEEIGFRVQDLGE